jgi:PiT family inorganic phosphate transporter
VEPNILLFLTSGLLLGWAFGANHLGNVFGAAIGTRMLSFAAAALICSVFVILGAVVSGAGPTQTLGKLGAVNALAGSFMTALASGITMYTMTRAGLPVSSTQAIVGGIIGWNFFSGTPTDTGALAKIAASWLAGPLLAAMLAMGLYSLVKYAFLRSRLHLLRMDAYTRIGLIVAGAFGAYSLGANNIANVMGVFVNAVPFTNVTVLGIELSPAQQLFLIGGIAIAVGIYTYSRKVVNTVGADLLQMSPAAAWVVVMSHSLVLMAFASQDLESFLAWFGLPTIPLVPVSSSEVAVGAVLGIALLQGGAGMRWRVMGRIGIGWVLTPLVAGVLCFVGLFFLQNVFQQQVYREVRYDLTPQARERLAAIGVPDGPLHDLAHQAYPSGASFVRAVNGRPDLDASARHLVVEYAEVGRYAVTPAKLATIRTGALTTGQLAALQRLSGSAYDHRWQLADALAAQSEEWRLPAAPARAREAIHAKLDFVYRALAED